MGEAEGPLLSGGRSVLEPQASNLLLVVLQGVSHAGPHTEDMALCYGNRSAALFHLGQFEVSIKCPLCQERSS